MIETPTTTPDPSVVKYLAHELGNDDAERAAAALPGLTVEALRGLDKLCAAAHGIQTEIEVAFEDDRLHYRATGPVLAFSELEDWHTGDFVSTVQTHGNQWSGYNRRHIHATAADLVYRVARV